MTTTSPGPAPLFIYAGMDPAVGASCPVARPRSAQLVGAVEWAWAPTNNRLDTYHLSSNRPRTHWILWKSTFDEIAVKDGPAQPYAFVPRHELSPIDAARSLLLAGWQGESADWLAMECEPLEPFHRVSIPGLLNRRDWLDLRKRAWP